jgi:hypothetical protein
MFIGVPTTVTVKVHELELPPLSRAVLVTVVVPSGKAKPLAGTLVTLVTAQLSLAVTVNVTLLVQTPGAELTLMLAGQVKCGGCVSSTVTVNVHVLVLSLVSRAVLVTVVMPTGNANPLAGTLVRLLTRQLSAALTVKVTLLVQTPGARFTVRFAGQVICGSCVSITVTVNVHVLALPLPSRAVLVTIVVPSGKAKPLAGLLVLLVTAQLSVAMTVKVTLLVHTPGVAFTMIFSGQLIAGASRSSIKTTLLQLPMQPVVSVTCSASV